MGIKATSFVKNTVPIGTVFYHISSVPPEGAFLLNGQIIYNCSTLYPEFYQYVTSNDGVRKITSFVYESELSSIGICGGFVVDSENGSIRLPNVSNGFIEGSNGNNTGNVLGAGLPNITGSAANIMTSYNTAIDGHGTGSLSMTAIDASGPAQTASKQVCRLNIDASKSSSIYGNSNTVQPKSVCYSVCIQVFNTTTSLSSQESAQIASEMQGKAGINLENLTANGKSVIVDIAHELDYSSKTSITANIVYQTTTGGMLSGSAYITTGTDRGTFFLQCSPVQSDLLTGHGGYRIGTYILAQVNSQHLFLPVPSGWYYGIYIAGNTALGPQDNIFIPFKN